MDSQHTNHQSSAPGDYFATTRWTVVVSASDDSTPQGRLALEELCLTYWYPLYAYVRRRGHSKEDAEDLTQAFFAAFLKKNYLEHVNGEKGKFRAFLLAALKHFLANHWDRAQCQKRGGGVVHLPLDWHQADVRFGVDPADNASPDKIFDRDWAIALLETVIQRLRQEHATCEKARLFKHLEPFLMLGKAAIPYTKASAELGMSEGALRVTVHRMRARYRELLRAEIAQTLSDSGQVEEEMKSLFSSFGD